MKKNEEPEPLGKKVRSLSRSRSEPGVFGSLEPEPREKKNQEPEPLEKKQEPEPLVKKVRSRSWSRSR